MEQNFEKRDQVSWSGPTKEVKKCYETPVFWKHYARSSKNI